MEFGALQVVHPSEARGGEEVTDSVHSARTRVLTASQLVRDVSPAEVRLLCAIPLGKRVPRCHSPMGSKRL